MSDGFEAIVAALGERPGVERPAGRSASDRSFGSSALRVNDRIFAFVSGDRLVLKLPARRVAGLILAGDGHPYDAGKGRPMREWIAIDHGRHEAWLALATEALAFVGGAREVTDGA